MTTTLQFGNYKDPDFKFKININDAISEISYPLSLTHTSQNTTIENNFGVGLEFKLENNISEPMLSGNISTVWDDFDNSLAILKFGAANSGTIDKYLSLDSLGNLNISGNLSLDGDFESAGNITTLDLTVNGSAVCNTTLEVIGDTTLSTLNVTGDSNLQNLNVSGTAELSSTLNVVGDTTVVKFTTTGTTSLSDLTVAGASVLHDNLLVDGDTTLNNLTVTGNVSLEDLTLNSLIVTTTTELNSTLTVAGNTTIINLTANGDIVLGENDTNTISLLGGIDTDIIPKTDVDISLGSSSFRYVDSFISNSIFLGSNASEIGNALDTDDIVTGSILGDLVLKTNNISNSVMIGTVSDIITKFKSYGQISTINKTDFSRKTFMVGNITTNATTTNLYIDHSSLQMVLPANSTWSFVANICARRTDIMHESASYEIKGCIDNNSNSVALVGSISKTVIAEDNAPWDVTAIANNTNKSLVLQVTGEAGKTISWLASVDIVEIIGG